MNNTFTKKLIYGGDYYPEQWLDEPEILSEDIRLMKKVLFQSLWAGSK